MSYRRSVRSYHPRWLPPSVDTEEEAKSLIIAACPRDDRGTYYARELAEEQTLENLQMFSDKLARIWVLMQERRAIRKGGR